MEADEGGTWPFLRLWGDGSVFLQIPPNSCGMDRDVVVGVQVPGNGVGSGVVARGFERGPELRDEFNGALWSGCGAGVGAT